MLNESAVSVFSPACSCKDDCWWEDNTNYREERTGSERKGRLEERCVLDLLEPSLGAPLWGSSWGCLSRVFLGVPLWVGSSSSREQRQAVLERQSSRGLPLVGWLVGRLVGWLVGRLVGWFVGWLAGWWVCWLSGLWP